MITLANPYVAGLILAAPYGAVMSTVSGFLLIISSGLVRDLYQRFLRPTASEKEIEWASYAATVGVGLVVAADRAAAAAVPATDHRLLQHGDGLGVPDARPARRLLAAGDRRGDRGDARRRGRDARPLPVRLPPRSWTEGLRPRHRRRSAGAFVPYYLLGLDPCVWGLPRRSSRAWS